MRNLLLTFALLFACFGVHAQDKSTLNLNRNLELQGGSVGFFRTNLPSLLQAIGSTYITPSDLTTATNKLATTNDLATVSNQVQAVSSSNDLRLLITTFQQHTQTLGSAAFTASSVYATAAQGSKADTAVQPGSLATVATSGAYADLTGKPTLGTASASNATAFATAAQGTKADTAVQPGSLGTAAYSNATNFATAAQGAKADTALQSIPNSGVTAGTYSNATVTVGLDGRVTSITSGSTSSSSGVIGNSTMNGRLTLISGQSITTTNATNSTIYYTPHNGNRVSLYDGSSWYVTNFTERSLAFTGMGAGTNWDVFIYNNSGTLTLERVGWTDDTTRATALALQDGVYVKTGDATKRYLGTIRTVATNSVTDNARQRLVYNLYNKVSRTLLRQEETGSWSYGTATMRQANNNTTNQVEVVVGLPDTSVELDLAALVRSAATQDILAAIGENSTSTPATNSTTFVETRLTSYFITMTASYSGVPRSGFSYWAWLEMPANGSATFYGSAAFGSVTVKSGLIGKVTQ